MDSENVRRLAAALAAYFPEEELRYKVQAVAGKRCLPCCYITARHVMDRLDGVVGPENWQDAYQVLPSGAVVCTLRVRMGGEWIAKADVGGESEQPDEGDKVKAAFSDALKRAAVKFGIGRYIYDLQLPWMDYDAQKKTYVGLPVLPAWARPHAAPRPAAPAPAAPAPAAPPAPPVAPAAETGPAPQKVASLGEKIARWDAEAAQRGIGKPGDLRAALLAELSPRYGSDLSTWPTAAEKEVREVAAAYGRNARGTIGPGQVTALLATLEAAGRTFPDLCRELGWPDTLHPTGLTGVAWSRAMAAITRTEAVSA